MTTVKENKFSVNEHGYYGKFGGAFIPEMLYPNVKQLQEQYLQIMYEPAFQQQFRQLLKDYVGRPTPLYTGATGKTPRSFQERSPACLQCLKQNCLARNKIAGP